MARVSLHVIDGVDKGRRFVDLVTPVTIGREEGNLVRLNDERVSRFHAKVQEDHGQLVLTDLDSTNGTRVNGEPVQLRLLRPGDRLHLGRSTLLVGTLDEIRDELFPERNSDEEPFELTLRQAPDSSAGTDLAADVIEHVTRTDMEQDVFDRTPPPLPARLSPAQAAQLSEVLDFLHRALADATSGVRVPPQAEEARLPRAAWQRVQAVLTFLARYSRDIGGDAD